MSGECENNGTFTLEDLLKGHALEERVYRLRCVEAWSMVIPWVGVPLADVLKRFKPTSKAKYVAFKTVMRPAEMPGQRYDVLEWPYVEGLRIDEAMHPLAILAVGLYGKTLPNQNGAPLRLITPWKYGFKGIKSIVEIRFTERQPPTSWNISAPHEYGFYANVNPKVDHPRWSQARERRIGGGLFESRVATLMFNGYEQEVAALYKGMDLEEILSRAEARPTADPAVCRRLVVRRVLKPALFVLCLLPLASLVWRAFEIGGTNLGANPVEKIQDTLGQWGLRFLLITLAVTPLRDWFNAPWLIQLRRMLGVYRLLLRAAALPDLADPGPGPVLGRHPARHRAAGRSSRSASWRCCC